MARFSGKVALVTGATSGIGRDTALALAREGAAVAFTGRREPEGRALQDQITRAGGRGLYIKADASSEPDCKRMVEETVRAFGGLHAAFNNAGVEGAFGPAVEQTVENYRHVFDTNVLGVLLSMKHEIPAMLRSGGGSIVNNSSIAGHIGFAGGTVYFASKHAVEGLTKCAALEVAKSGVRINTVCPAGVETDMYTRFTGGSKEAQAGFIALHPIGRIGQPREITAGVLWMLSDEASFMTGQSLILDGGFTAP